MSDLIVMAFEDEFSADQVLADLLRLQKAHLVDMEDAVIARKKKDGKLKIRQTVDLMTAGALGGGFWGTLIGLVAGGPILGLALGAGMGALSGALGDIGVDDDFVDELGETLQPGSSAIFVLLREFSADKVLQELEGVGGKILHTSLNDDAEQRLQAALDEAKQAASQEDEQ